MLYWISDPNHMQVQVMGHIHSSQNCLSKDIISTSIGTFCWFPIETGRGRIWPCLPSLKVVWQRVSSHLATMLSIRALSARDYTVVYKYHMKVHRFDMGWGSCVAFAGHFLDEDFISGPHLAVHGHSGEHGRLPRTLRYMLKILLQHPCQVYISPHQWGQNLASATLSWGWRAAH